MLSYTRYTNSGIVNKKILNVVIKIFVYYSKQIITTINILEVERLLNMLRPFYLNPDMNYEMD